MTSMRQSWKRYILGCAILAVLCSTGCSRPTNVPTAGDAQSGQAPFQPDGGAPAGPAASSKEPSEAGLPFHDSQSLPAGTLVTVRLKSPITAGGSISGNSFEAVVDDPIVVEGNTLIPAGTAVAGRVEAARISTVKPNRAYVRLALESVHIGGLDVPVQTASLFARQTPEGEDVIRLEKGRRLTFRLTEPVFISTQRAQAGR
jgi:hypothetical protein